MAARVGIIANPISARDIRRVVASANSVQITDRANIVLRALAALSACGIEDVVIECDPDQCTGLRAGCTFSADAENPSNRYL